MDKTNIASALYAKKMFSREKNTEIKYERQQRNVP